MQGYDNTLFIKKKCIHYQCLIFRIIIVLSCVKIFKSYYLIRLLMNCSIGFLLFSNASNWTFCFQNTTLKTKRHLPFKNSPPKIFMIIEDIVWSLNQIYMCMWCCLLVYSLRRCLFHLSIPWLHKSQLARCGFCD